MKKHAMSIGRSLIFIYSYLFLISISLADLGELEKGWASLLHQGSIKNKEFFLFSNNDFNLELKSIKNLLLEKPVPNKKTLWQYSEKKLQLICQFPARVYYLIENDPELRNIDSIKLENTLKFCPELSKWIENTLDDNKSINVVFASQYLNNPASMFGHTFLHFENKKLAFYLQVAVDYAASIPPSTNGIQYIFKGTTGGFKGRFAYAPFLLKIREYNNSEGRDLYEFPLNLNEKEKTLFVLHLYELMYFSQFDYYFFTENCSYMILKALGAVLQNENLTSGLAWYTLPLETLSKLDQSRLLLKGNQIKHDSLLKGLSKQYEQLSSHDKNSYFDIIKDYNVSKLNNGLSVPLADSLLTHMEIRRYKGEEEKKEFYRALLLKRSSLPSALSSSPIVIQSKKQIYEGHAPRSLGLELGKNKMGEFWGFDFKPAVHSLDDQDLGFVRFSEIDVLHAKVRTYERKPYMDKIKILSMATYVPFENKIENNFSWSLSLEGGRDELALDSNYQFKETVRGEIGLGHDWWSKSLFTLLSLENRLEYHQRGIGGVNYMPGPAFHLFLTLGEWYKLKFDSYYFLPSQSEMKKFYILSLSQNFYFSCKSSLQISYQKISRNKTEEFVGKLSFYF